jgi:hypothetical protein
MSVVGAEAIMIKNGLYSRTTVTADGADVEVGGVLILQDGELHGGDSYVYYTGTYDCNNGKWEGEMMSREHNPTTRPTVERVQSLQFVGTYSDHGAEADATAFVGKQGILTMPSCGC